MKSNNNLKFTAGLIFLAAAIYLDETLSWQIWAKLILYIPSYLIFGIGTLKEAAEGILHGELLNESFLMSIATIGALSIGFLPGAEPQFTEAVAIMAFFGIGEAIEDIADDKSRKSIESLMDIRPDTALVERDGRVAEVSPESVSVGEIIRVNPGDRIPLDGVIVSGSSAVDTMALTGESLPLDVSDGDEIYSGCVNLSGALKIRVTKEYGESTVTRILELVEKASGNKSKSEKFITSFSKWYTPSVVSAAILISFAPPIISGDFRASFAEWLYRGLVFLIVSCPCALAVSVPLAFFVGIGGASRQGILVKGGNYIDALAKTGIAVFDKTGTLTEGKFGISEIKPCGIGEKELLNVAYQIEKFSNHPIARSLCESAGGGYTCGVSDVNEIPGEGIEAVLDGKRTAVGNDKLMKRLGFDVSGGVKYGTEIHVASDGKYLGSIVMSDSVKDDAEECIAKLKKMGVGKTVMLTGDAEVPGRAVAEFLNIDEYHTGLLPSDKVGMVEKLISEKGKKERLVFVGDGINDAPVLCRADVGIAMGGLGSDAAVEAADIVIMDDKPSKVANAVAIARRTVAIAKENIVFALVIKLAVMILSFFDAVPMTLAVFADVGVTIVAVLNSLRAGIADKKV